MDGLVICIKLNSDVSHIFYACPFSQNTDVLINMKQDKYYLSLDTYTTWFAWGDRNLEKII